MERKYKKVSFAEAEEIIESRPERLIFDVREEEEYNLGHAKGALLFPVDSITRETAAEQIPAADTPTRRSTTSAAWPAGPTASSGKDGRSCQKQRSRRVLRQSCPALSRSHR